MYILTCCQLYALEMGCCVVFFIRTASFDVTIFHAEFLLSQLYSTQSFFENACRRSREIVIYVFPNWLYINHKALFCNTLAPFELSNGGRAANYISRRVFDFSTIFHAEFLLSQLYFTQSFLKMTAGWVGALLFICSQIDYMSIIKPEFAILLPLLDCHMGQEYQLYFTQSFLAPLLLIVDISKVLMLFFLISKILQKGRGLYFTQS